MPCAPAGPRYGVCSGAFGIVADQVSATFCNPHRERHDSCNLSTADLASDHRSSAQEPGPPRHSHAGASAPPRGLRGARRHRVREEHRDERERDDGHDDRSHGSRGRGGDRESCDERVDRRNGQRKARALGCHQHRRDVRRVSFHEPALCHHQHLGVSPSVAPRVMTDHQKVRITQ